MGNIRQLLAIKDKTIAQPKYYSQVLELGKLIIGGAAAGAATGNLTADRVVVIKPDESIL